MGCTTADRRPRKAKLVNADNEAAIVLAPLAVDTDTAARLVGLSPSTVRALMRRGDLVARYSGTKPIFIVDELRAFLETLPSEPRHQ